MKTPIITIATPSGKRKIGQGYPVFIVAELSGNHNQNYARARRVIDTAIDAGVDAVKLQTYTPDTLTIESNKKWFIPRSGPWVGQTLYELYKKTYTPWKWQPKLKRYAEKKGILLFSTPFDETAVDFLEKMNVAAYKVASFELPDVWLLKRIAKTKKPVILSRGMASKKEITLALKTLRQNGTSDIALLHCVSAYPVAPEDMNLSTITDIARRFKVVTGLSDHSLSPIVPVVAVALGASIVEKHITLSRTDGGADARFSLEPNELRNMVRSIREAEKTIGKPTYMLNAQEADNMVFRRSIFSVQDIATGESLTRENVRVIRPGYGLAPKFYHSVLGKRAKKLIKKGTPLSLQLITLAK